MRFDDRLQTATAIVARDGAEAARWIQLVDLLAQPLVLTDAARVQAFSEARRLSPAVSDAKKRSAAMAVAARVSNADLVELFASEPPRIAAPVLLGAKLPDDAWVALIPRLSPPSRALLRERRDLPSAANDALLAFGRSDFALSDGRQTLDAVDIQPAGVSRISDLVARIESWRIKRESPIADGMAAGQLSEPVAVEKFRFEADDSGTIIWVSGAPSPSVTGISLAELADPVCPGVDGQTAGAFAKRADISNGRMMLPAGMAMEGLWRIDARPLFNSDSGKFCGYAGLARRSAGQQQSQAATAPSPEVLRQIVHELRSPLNAICGFAELIEYQIAGPAGQGYRARASAIVSEAGHMLMLIERLDETARSSLVDAKLGESLLPNKPPERASA